jgi:two-component system OmpR family sensor kinase
MDGGAPGRRRTLPRRLVGGALAALVLSLAVGMLLTFELVLVNERSALDRSLRRQQDHLARDVAAALAAEPRSPGRDPQIVAAVQRFLALDPPTQAYVTVVRVGDIRLVSGGADPRLDTLARIGGLDLAPTATLATVHTAAGDLRAIRTALFDGERVAGSVVIAGLLDPARGEAFAALRRLAAGGAVGLAVGALVTAVVVRRITRPLVALADAAATTQPRRLGTRVEVSGDDEIADLGREFNAMLDRLDAAAAEREQLIATISHELRTPLAIARGNVELAERVVRNATDPADALRALAITRAELDRTTRLVGDLLALGRSGHPDFLDRRPTHLPAFVREIELRIDGLGLDTVTVAPAPDVTVLVDTARLLQAVLNAVLNGVGHNPSGTTVDVVCAVEGGDLVIRVIDDGPGIPAAARETVFEAFVTGDGHGTGTGLGLAVVAAVAAAHGGTARLVDDGPGTTVEVRLPGAGGSPVAG